MDLSLLNLEIYFSILALVPKMYFFKLFFVRLRRGGGVAAFRGARPVGERRQGGLGALPRAVRRAQGGVRGHHRRGRKPGAHEDHGVIDGEREPGAKTLHPGAATSFDTV